MNLKMHSQKMTVGTFLADWGAVASIAVVFILFSIAAPKTFFNPDNMITILRSISITTVIAIGVTFAFSANIFDLSFAAVATVAAAFSITFMAWYGIPMIPALILTVLVCMVVGVVNTIVSVRLRVPAFLATLAMSFVLDGLSLTYSGGSVINPMVAGAKGQAIVMQIPDTFWQIGKAPVIIIIMFACVVFVDFFQQHTKHGRFLYVVGSNAEAGRLSGIKVNNYRMLSFVATAGFAALGGILIASRAGTVQAAAGSGFLMPAIAAVSIGQSLAGKKKANAWGTFVGAALIGVVENGLYCLAFPYYSINIVKGLILIAALIMSHATTKEQA